MIESFLLDIEFIKTMLIFKGEWIELLIMKLINTHLSKENILI